MIERDLWAAVIQRAIDDLCGIALHNDIRYAAGIRQSALDWFRSENNGPGAFVWICRILDIDPPTARRRIFGLSRQSLKEQTANRWRRRDNYDPYEFIHPDFIGYGLVRIGSRIRRASA